MIRRTYDAELVNGLINDPEIRPTIGGQGILDSSPLLLNGNNICLVNDRGGALFAWRGPRVFEGHSFFKARGREAISLGVEILEAMMPHADLVWGLTPIALRHVRWFNRKIGFSSMGEFRDPVFGLCELFEMRF